MITQDCLANTGTPASGVLLFIGVAVVCVGLGVVAMRGRKNKRAILGALALIGTLALAPLASPSAAYALTGDCATSVAQPTPDADPTPQPGMTYVIPAAPTTAPVCGAEPMIVTPESEYFSYATTQNGTNASVTASLKPGFANLAVEPGAQTVWTFDTTFAPVTVLTAQNLAFTFDYMEPSAHLNNQNTAAFLEQQSDSIEFKTVVDYTYTYALFTEEGDELPEFGQTMQSNTLVTKYSAAQSGQDISLDLIDRENVDGYLLAEAYFAVRGGIPAGAHMDILRLESFSSDAHLTVTFVNECGIDSSGSATTPFEQLPD